MSEERLWSDMHSAKSEAEGAVARFIELRDRIDSGNANMAQEIIDIVYDASQGRIKLNYEDEK